MCVTYLDVIAALHRSDWVAHQQAVVTVDSSNHVLKTISLCTLCTCCVIVHVEYSGMVLRQMAYVHVDRKSCGLSCSDPSLC